MTHWNGARHCTSPKLQAAKFSRKVHTDKTLLAQEWTLSMAFVCAEVRCGNMGCQGMKKYTFLGGCVPWLHALERLNKTYGTTILHDNVTHSSVANAFYSKTDRLCVVPKVPCDTLVLSELREEMKTENEEWMYQLDRCRRSKPLSMTTTLRWRTSSQHSGTTLLLRRRSLATLTERSSRNTALQQGRCARRSISLSLSCRLQIHEVVWLNGGEHKVRKKCESAPKKIFPTL